MAGIGLYLPWDSQPQEATPVDRGAAIAPGLVFAWNASNPNIDASSGIGVTPVNAPTQSVTSRGINRKFLRASSQYYDAGTGPNVTFAGDMTVLVAYTLDAAPAATNTGMTLFGRDHISGGRSFNFEIFRKDADVPGSGVRFYTNGGGTPGTNVIAEGRLPVTGDARIAVVVWSPSTNTSQIWIDGALVASSTAATKPPAATTSARIAGRTYTGFTDYLTGQIPIVLAWNRRLGAAEVQDVSGNPWQIFAPRSIWVPVSAGGGGSSDPVGLATETDAAQTLAGKQIRALGLATETDFALALAGKQLRAVDLATEVDTAQALSSTAGTQVGMAVETDTAQALAGAQIRAVGRADETDAALALSAAAAGTAAGLALETNLALALSCVQIRLVGMASELETALVPYSELVQTVLGSLTGSTRQQSATRVNVQTATRQTNRSTAQRRNVQTATR